MADKVRMQKLIEDCQKDIAAYLPPESGITDYELLQRLITRLDGRQAKDALGEDWQGWWPKDNDDGDGGNGSPALKPELEPA
ncbi:hypothetical protein [Ensifer aridi]|uniref:hypothetical protein n=1 Tax=Ensifer aridi TaxID=1708715 RepID=UPI00358F8F3A